MILRKYATVYTNLDVVEGGVNDWLADELLLSDVTVMLQQLQVHLPKVITDPKNDADKVLETCLGRGWNYR